MNHRLLPRNEARRLTELRSHEIIDTAAEPAFERVVRLAARFFAMPMATVSFVEEFRVWCKANHGLRHPETAREASFCAHTILRKGVLVVRDARADARFHGHLCGGGPDFIRFYAGAPLRTAEGRALGALCVMDTSPREFTREDEATLADMAAIVMDELSLRRLTRGLRVAIAGGRRTQRTLTRQHRLLQRLGDSLEDRIHLRTTELVRANQSLREEVARRARADSALRRAKDQAEKANAAKNEFLARMSHELRTPLNAILGFGEILRGQVPAGKRRDCANHVVTAGRHLLSLINEVLDIARIEAGQGRPSLEPVRVSEVIAEVLDLIRPLAAVRRLRVETSGEDEARREIFADRRTFKQVLLNLLSNAVKYSPETGRIEVACRVEGTGKLRVSVTDEGPGVTSGQAGRLFVAFDRLGAEHSEVQGTGLGLSLSKRFVEAMGGKIGVVTAPNRGSTFWVSLPLAGGPVATSPEDVAPNAGRRRAARTAGPLQVEQPR